MEYKECNICGVSYPETSEYFGHQPNGNLRHQCRKCMAAKQRKWAKDNPEKIKARGDKRRRQERGAEGWFTDEDVNELLKGQDWECYYCGEDVRLGYHVDHKVPISHGGTNWPDNLAIACKKCNLDKHDKTVEEYMFWRFERVNE